MTQPDVGLPITDPNDPIMTAAKAVAATITTAVGVVALFISQFSDGEFTLQEGGTLAGAAIVALATIFTVWKTRNKPKG